jgi:carboxyl-terminal processing protease
LQNIIFHLENPISEVGVRPDIEVNEEGDDFRIKTDTDNQLNYAIKLLNG